MKNRIILSRSRNSTLQLTDCLRSLFLLELLAPSRTVYFISPWIGDLPVIENQFGQFRPVMPNTGQGTVMLSDLLMMLADRGALVRIIRGLDPSPAEDLLYKLPSEIEVRRAEHLHWKGLITEHYYLRGSMNFTFSGANINDESVELTTHQESIAYALAEAEHTWLDALP